MLTFKKHRKYFSVFLLLLCSLFTMFAFQNCGQPINSQSASSVADANTTSSTPSPAPMPIPNPTPGQPAPAPVPVPVPVPVPTPTPGTVLVAMTQAERAAACSQFLDRSKAASLTVNVTDLTLLSGLANGSGDVATGPASQVITTGLTTNNPMISAPAGKVANPAGCQVSTNISCTIATDPAHLAVINKAVNMDPSSSNYGKDEANPADQAKTNAIANTLFARNNTCASALAATTASSSRSFTLSNNRQNSGFRCAKGYAWIKMGVTTAVETSVMTPAPTAVTDFKYIKVSVNDTCWTESRLEPAAVLQRSSSLGSQLALSDSWSAVAAPYDYTGATVGVGALYMFRNVSGVWSYHSKISVSDAGRNDTITAAAISGTKLVFTSQNRNSYTGAAFMYNFNGTSWVLAQAFTPLSPQSGQMFGTSIAMNDANLVIGAPGYDNTAYNDLSGVAYVYGCTATNCNFRYAIYNTGKPGGAFGASLAIYGNRVAIGAPMSPVISSAGDGFVQVYDIAGGAALVKEVKPAVANVTADEPESMRFGSSVAMYGSGLLVGAPKYNSALDRIQSGVAYYYADYNSSAPRILNTAATANVNNGQSVALNSLGAFVGCPGCNAGREGIVRFYPSATIANSTVGYTLFPLNKATNSEFGSAISVTNLFVGVGAPVMSDPELNGGAGYIFKLP